MAHIIRAEQMEVDWLLARAYRTGRGTVGLAAAAHPAAVDELFGAPAAMMTEFLQKQADAQIAGRCDDFDGWFQARMRVEYLRGYFDQLRLARR